MMDHVDDTLRLWRRTRFKWGGVLPHVPGIGDCLLSIGEYIAARGGPDLTERFRGTYDDEAGARRLLEAHGGVIGLIDLTGLPHTTGPSRGDVVALDTGEMLVGALCTGPGIAARLERGVIEVERRLIKLPCAWKIV